jgi:hypothetical protein
MARVGSEGYPVDNGPALAKSLRAIDGTPPENQVRTGLAGGGRRIRTRGPSAKGKAVGSHSRQALPFRT